tara:strand:- start:25 stop:156 length:132 start_codon:yes stop_codon:yes gene_type:complete
MNKFEASIDALTMFILGDRRDGIDRRLKKSKRKKTRRTGVRRK